MASGDTAPPICHVCTSQFRFAGLEPFLMPCLHSVCQTCMALSSEIFCCSCKQRFSNDGSFPKNTAQAKSIFLTTLKNRPSEVRCTNRNDGRKATSWCPQCEALFCNTCEEMHKDMKLTKTHEITLLSSLLHDQEGLNPKTISCPHHPEQHTGLYDETCQELICYKCKAEDHAECKLSSTDLACDQFKETYLPEAMKQLEEKKEDISLIESEIHDLSSRLEPRLKAVKESIHQSFDTMRASLNQRENELIQQAEACFKEAEQNTKQRLEDLSLEKIRLDTALAMCGTVQRITFPLPLLGMISSMKNRVHVCMKSELPKVSKIEADINFSNKDEEDLKQIISSSGVISATWSKAAGNPFPNSGILSETRAQLNLCQEERRKTEKYLSFCVEKLKNIDSFTEKASFYISFDRTLEGRKESSVKVLKTVPWYICVVKNRETGDIGAYIWKMTTRDSRDSGWSCRLNATFEVLNISGKPITRCMDREFNTCSTSKGYKTLVPKSQLTDGLMELQVDVEVRESKGLIPLEDRLRKEFNDILAVVAE